MSSSSRRLQPAEPDEIVGVAEFNLWCAMQSKPFKLVQHAWPDGKVEWDLEIHPGTSAAMVVYGTGQQTERSAVVAAYGFLAGAEWAESALREEIIAALVEDDGAPPAAGTPVALVIEAPSDVEAEVPAADPPTEPDEAGAPVPPSVSVVRASVVAMAAAPAVSPAGYELPSLDFLAVPPPAADPETDEGLLARNARALETVLRNFGVRGEIMEVRPGPVVTLYDLEPAPGTKSSRIINLADDIARSMRAVNVRIAVVPGSSVIGIELPNPKRETVFLDRKSVV